MKKIKVKFVDFHPGQATYAPETYRDIIFYDILSKFYEVEISEDPDYIIYGEYNEMIFENTFGEHLKYKDCVKIFYTREDLEPDFNLCDYACALTPIKYGDRYFRLPSYYMPQHREQLYLCEHKHENLQNILQTKPEFCSFVVSNATSRGRAGADSIREKAFYALSDYKRVNSGGRFLNNIGMPSGVPDKLEFQKKHKFALAFENESHPGYTTEKLMQAFAAQTVPIYWGDPEVTQVFNPKAFICASDFETLEDMVDYVRKVDEDDELYLEMLRQPAFREDVPGPDEVLGEFESWVRHIFDQDKEKALRRNMVWAGDMYQSLRYNQWLKKKINDFTASGKSRSTIISSIRRRGWKKVCLYAVTDYMDILLQDLRWCDDIAICISCRYPQKYDFYYKGVEVIDVEQLCGRGRDGLLDGVIVCDFPKSGRSMRDDLIKQGVPREKIYYLADLM